MNQLVLSLKQSFGGKLIGTNSTKLLICQIVAKLPTDTIDYLTKHCWFLASTDDTWAYTFNGNDIADKHFIFLSDELLRQEHTQIEYTILHEIGHVVLKHRNSINYRQTKQEINIQEQAADHFARMFL